MQLNIVVLPAPFGPIRPRISPPFRANETPSSATMPPKRNAISRISSSAPPVPAPALPIGVVLPAESESTAATARHYPRPTQATDATGDPNRGCIRAHSLQSIIAAGLAANVTAARRQVNGRQP